jgi:hypothetical protein
MLVHAQLAVLLTLSSPPTPPVQCMNLHGNARFQKNAKFPPPILTPPLS